MKNIDLTTSLKFGKLMSAIVMGAILVSGCKDDFTSPANPQGSTIFQVISADPNLSITTAALLRTNQSASLDNNNSGTFTLFAPSDSAFVAYFQTKLAKPVTYNKDSVLNYIKVKMSATSTVSVSALSAVLTYHIISSKLTSAELTGDQTFATLNGARLSISKYGTTIVLNGNTTANGAKIQTLDAAASNGVVHTINRVLVPVTTATAASLLGISVSYATTPPTVTVGATSGSNYDVLAAGISRAGIASTLLPNVSPLPDITVFAPNDAAFIAYLNVANEAAAITAIKAMDPGTLAAILNYHIVASKVVTTDLASGAPVNTVNGKTFTVSISGTTISLVDQNASTADAKIVSPNNLTNAGVVHGIDHVMLPQ